ncbi:MAG: gamma-glutamyl kinase [Pseudomonadota bacterium]
MMIFFKERLAYLAVPKTGTTAIERALHRRASAVFRDPPGIKHTNARGYERKFRLLFDRSNLAPVETVAIMREPVSWLGSWYRYRQRAALSGHKNSTEGISFDRFVEAYLSETQPDFAKLGSQARFLTDDKGTVLASYVFPYEDFTPFLGFLKTRLGEEPKLDRVNASPEGNVTLSPSLLAELKQKHFQDFEIHAQISASERTV